MEDLSGRPYSRLKTAYLYRTEYNESCKCKSDPWEQEATDRHRAYALEAAKRKGDKTAAQELDALNARFGVPEHLQGCHATVIEGYVIEGHVPVAAISRLLQEKPPIPGISLPGMPEGSPGMSGTKQGAFAIFVISDEEKPPLYAIE